MATILKRNGKWRAQVRRDGHNLSKTFRLKSAAEEWAREAEHAIDKQISPTAPKVTRKTTFANLIDLHIEDLRIAGKTMRRSKRHVLRRLRMQLGTVPLPDLTRERLIAYGRKRKAEGAGPATLAIDISFIGTVLTHAAAVHGINVNTEAVRLARIALRMLGLVGKSRERDRRPTETELNQLFEYFDGKPRQIIPMSRIIKFAIASAMREEEICRIDRNTRDQRTRTILIVDRKDPREKEGNDQRVPLLSVTGYDAWALLEEEIQRHPFMSRCFPYNSKSISASFTRACKALKIDDLHFHDLRHEATSRLFEAGLTIEQVPLVTGHKDWKMLKRYTQLRPEGLFAKLQRTATPPTG